MERPTWRPLRTVVASVAGHLQPGTLVILESTDAILKLLAEPELRRQMGANGHKVALREYDWNRLSTEFVRVMDGVAERVQPR